MDLDALEWSSSHLASRPVMNQAENQLENLLLEGSLLEIYVDQIKLLTKLVHSSRRSYVTSEVRGSNDFVNVAGNPFQKPKAARLQAEKNKPTAIRKRKSHEILSKTGEQKR